MKNLKELRLECGFSLAQIAEFFHVGAGTVHRWETGETVPSVFQILKLCRIVNCSPSQLYGVEDNHIPVFTTDKTLHSVIASPAENSADRLNFGLVLPYDISDRFLKDDICIFSADSCAENGNLVLAVDNNYNEHLYIYKDYDANMQIIAICRHLFSKY